MQRKLKKKRTNIKAFVQECDAIMEGINAGLADIIAGRVHTHKQAMTHIAQKFGSVKRRTIIDFVERLRTSGIDTKVDLKELYYQEQAKRYGFGGKDFSN